MKKFLLIIFGIIGSILLPAGFAIADNGFQLSNEYVSGIDVPRTDETISSDPEALYIVIKVINRILSLTSVVALIIFLIGGYKMLIANGDDSKMKAGVKIIKNAIIGLVIIGLTWAIVRLIFRLVGNMGGDGNFDTGGGG